MGFRFSRRIKIAPGLSLNLSKSGISTSARLGPLTLNSRGTASVRTGIPGLSYRENLNTKPRTRKPKAQPAHEPVAELADVRFANGMAYQLPVEVAELLKTMLDNFNSAMQLAEDDPSVAVGALDVGLGFIAQVEGLSNFHPECIADCVADMRAAYNTTVVQVNA